GSAGTTPPWARTDPLATIAATTPPIEPARSGREIRIGAIVARSDPTPTGVGSPVGGQRIGSTGRRLPARLRHARRGCSVMMGADPTRVGCGLLAGSDLHLAAPTRSDVRRHRVRGPPMSATPGPRPSTAALIGWPV